MFRRALFAEGGAVVRLLYSTQNETADACRGLLRIDLFYIEKPLGIVFVKFVAQLVATFRDGPDTAPFAIADFENSVDQILRDPIAVPLHDARILVLNFMGSSFQLLDGHERALQDIDRLETGDDYGHTKAFCDRFVLAIAHDGANVTRTEKSLHAVQRRLQDRSDGWRGSFETNREKHNFLVRVGARNFQAIDRRINNADVRATRFEDQKIDI